ncbi:hypothetical protein [Streptomyces rochei]|uniref:hypothetical protein n=1 Tax=Streptomyces rochei TaxID=1928 RepID=UPI00117EE88C|nr:hypothetical protein [Streptomyces rochei]
MKDIDTSAFYALIPSLEPLKISDYLASEGWTLMERREGLLEYWEEPRSPSESQSEKLTYLLPLSYEIRNFERRLVEFLVELADFYECDADGIRERLINRDCDAVLVRVLSQERSDSIGLFEAKGVLEAGLKLVELSALYTANPKRSFSGPKGKVVNSFMRDYVLLGHTKPGSFVFPIFSVANPTDGDIGSFSREVMENLASGLRGAHSMLNGEARDTGQENRKFELALLNTVEKLSKLPGSTSFDISFLWASARPVPPEVPRRPIGFDADMLESPLAGRRIRETATAMSIESAAERRESETSNTVTVRGPIVALGIDDRWSEGQESSHFIVIRVSEGEGLRDIRVPVNEGQFDRALGARKSRLPVAVEGTLGRNGEAHYNRIVFPSDSLRLELPSEFDEKSN